MLRIFFAFLCGIVTGLAVAYFLYARVVDRQISDRMAPYENYQSALAFARDEEYELALKPVARAYGFWKENPRSEHFAAAVDLYLDCLSLCDNPMNHNPEFLSISAHFVKDVPLFGWQYDRIGLYHLRTGKLNDATQALQKGIHSREVVEHDSQRTAWSHYLLSLCYLADEKTPIDSAVEEAVKAHTIDPDKYPEDVWTSGENGFAEDKTASEVLSSYAKAKADLIRYLLAVEQRFQDL
jgi:tetratricopeptide (TPR) repeat protein